MSRSVLLMTLLFTFFVQTPTPPKRPDYALDRTAGQGQIWLTWTRTEREKFILGYLRGYQLGFNAGCLAYFEGTPPKVMKSLSESPLQKCKLQELNYSKGADYYAGQISAFYETFPSDIDVPVSWLIQALSDSENKTPEEVHAAWSKGHAHP